MYKMTTHDYNIYHRNTYLSAKIGEQVLPILTREFNGNGSTIRTNATVFTPTGKENTVIDVSEINFSSLERGCINLSKSVFVLNEKSPDSGEFRHRKTLSPGNTKIIDPFSQERELLHSIPLCLDDYTVLNAIINSSYSSAQEALENVLSFRRIAQAFHPDYFFGIKYRPNSVMLFRRDKMIGKVTANGTILLKPKAHPLFEELSEYGLDVKKVAR